MRKFTRVATVVLLAPIFAGSTLSTMAPTRANQQAVGGVDTTGTVPPTRAQGRYSDVPIPATIRKPGRTVRKFYAEWRRLLCSLSVG